MIIKARYLTITLISYAVVVCLLLYSFKLQPFFENDYRVFLTKSRYVTSVSCAKIFDNDRAEIQKAKNIGNDGMTALSTDMLFNLSQDCSKYLQERQYLTFNPLKEEIDLPIAFSIMIHKDVNQFERLLRSIYRPQNFYCIHADAKMSEIERKTTASLARCFNNVFMSSTSFDVQYAGISSVQADIVCMKDLLAKKWKYFINLTGQEFPLQSILDIVKILQVYNGANDVKVSSRDFSSRWRSAGTPPDGLIPYKGRVHIIVNRDYVEFVVKNKTTERLMEWMKSVIHPGELIFPMINYNSKIRLPGSLNGEKLSKKNNEFPITMARYKLWEFLNPKECNGKFVRDICIFGTGDLPALAKRPELFVNKVYWDYHPFVLDCLEEYIHNITVDSYLGRRDLNISFYSNLYFVTHAMR